MWLWEVSGSRNLSLSLWHTRQLLPGRWLMAGNFDLSTPYPFSKFLWSLTVSPVQQTLSLPSEAKQLSVVQFWAGHKSAGPRASGSLPSPMAWLQTFAPCLRGAPGHWTSSFAILGMAARIPWSVLWGPGPQFLELAAADSARVLPRTAGPLLTPGGKSGRGGGGRMTEKRPCCADIPLSFSMGILGGLFLPSF